MKRYKNNWGSFISQKEQKQLLSKTIVIIGVGGNGGYTLEYFSRLGVKKIIFFDGDIFEESNLNRQIYCNKNTLSQNKAIVAYEKIKNINPSIQLEYYPKMFSMEDISMIMNADIIIDCTDGLTVEILQEINKLHIPYAFQGNIEQGSIVSIFNNSYFFNIFLNEIKQEEKIITPVISQPAYLCALTACLVCNEVVKFLLHKPCAIGYYLVYDIINNTLKKEFI